MMQVDGEDALVVPLAEIRAGLMSVGRDGMMQADPRKGLLRVAQSEDTLIHVQWFQRQGHVAVGPPELDTVTFPGECQLRQITGQPRCYMLAFAEDASRNVYLWLQEPKAASDATLIAGVNAAVNGEAPVLSRDATPAPVTPAVQPASTAAVPQPAAAVSATPDATALAAALLAQLTGQPPHGAMGHRRPDKGPGLHEVMKPDLLIPLMQQPDVYERVAPHLPEQHRTPAHLAATLRSPQFMQQVATFSAAVQSGQLDLSQFGLRVQGFSIADFLEAVQELADRESHEGPAAGSRPPAAQPPHQ